MGTIISIVLAYLLGSLSSAIIVAKFMKLGDPRTEGSNNPGFSNMYRMHGKQVGAIVLAGDILKGTLAVWLGYLFGADGFMVGLVGLAAVLGHIFPLFFGFKGGRGVATTVGAVLGFSMLVGIVAILVWLAVAYLFRYASLASLAVAVVCPILILFSNAAIALPALIMSGLVAWQHMENIKRLQEGTETKLEL